MPINKEDVCKLLEFVKAGDVENLRLWMSGIVLSDRENLINSTLHSGENALCMSCRNGNEEIVRLLLENGASVNVRGSVVLREKYVEGVYAESFIEQYPIHAAVNSENFNANILQLIIDKLKVGNLNIPTQLDSREYSPLYYATAILDANHRYNCLKKMLDSGIDYSKGKDPAAIVLCVGIKEEYRDVRDIELLLERCTLVILAPIADIGNCLYMAAACGYKEAAEAIIAKAKSMDDTIVAQGRKAGVLQALINNDDGDSNDLTKIAEYYGHNHLAEWVRDLGLPAPELYKHSIQESDASENLDNITEEEGVGGAAAGYSQAKRHKADSEAQLYDEKHEEFYDPHPAQDQQVPLSGINSDSDADS